MNVTMKKRKIVKNKLRTAKLDKILQTRILFRLKRVLLKTIEEVQKDIKIEYIL